MPTAEGLTLRIAAKAVNPVGGLTLRNTSTLALAKKRENVAKAAAAAQAALYAEQRAAVPDWKGGRRTLRKRSSRKRSLRKRKIRHR